MAYVYMGERFGVPPWEIENAPLDRLRYYLGVLAAEADGLDMVDGLPDTERLIIGEDA